MPDLPTNLPTLATSQPNARDLYQAAGDAGLPVDDETVNQIANLVGQGLPLADATERVRQLRRNGAVRPTGAAKSGQLSAPASGSANALAVKPAASMDGGLFYRAAERAGIGTDHTTLNKLVAAVNEGATIDEAVAQVKAAAQKDMNDGFNG